MKDDIKIITLRKKLNVKGIVSKLFTDDGNSIHTRIRDTNILKGSNSNSNNPNVHTTHYKTNNNFSTDLNSDAKVARKYTTPCKSPYIIKHKQNRSEDFVISYTNTYNNLRENFYKPIIINSNTTVLKNNTKLKFALQRVMNYVNQPPNLRTYKGKSSFVNICSPKYYQPIKEIDNKNPKTQDKIIKDRKSLQDFLFKNFGAKTNRLRNSKLAYNFYEEELAKRQKDTFKPLKRFNRISVLDEEDSITLDNQLTLISKTDNSRNKRRETDLNFCFKEEKGREEDYKKSGQPINPIDLNRLIKLHQLTNRTKRNGTLLPIVTIRELKDGMKDIEGSMKLLKRAGAPKFLKKNFNTKTIQKYRMLNGKHFGV